MVLGTIGCALGEELRELPKVDCHDNQDIVVHVQSKWVQFGDVPDGGNSPFMMHTRAYVFDDVNYENDMSYFPGPIIRMHGNTNCRINVVNDLEPNGDAGCGPDGPHHNEFHCPNSTTLHTHGLHVSTFDDNINSNVRPGESLTYNYTIATNHLPGTHWYHGHRHGNTALQVTGGMAGMLIVEPASTSVLQHSLLYSTLYRAETFVHEMVLFHSFTGTGDGGGGGFSMDTINEINGQFANEPEMMYLFDGPAPENDFYTVNNQINPTISVMSESTHLLRVLHVGAWRVLRIVPEVPVGVTCEMNLMARDGVFQTPQPDDEGTFPTLSSIVLVQGTRADIAVKCTGPVGSIIPFNAPNTVPADFPLGDTNMHFQDNIFTIEITADMDPALAGWLPQVPAEGTSDLTDVMPEYLRQLLAHTPDTPLAAEEAPPGSGVAAVGFTGNPAGINGNPFPGYGANQYVASFCVDKIYSLMLGPPPPGPPSPVNAGPAHPFHVHINHVQIEDTPDGLAWSPDVVREGEFRDVVPAKQIAVRFPTADFPGEYITHCHILQHEDRGMMGLFEVAKCCSVDADCQGPCDTGGFCDATGKCAGMTPVEEGTSCTNGIAPGVCNSYGECTDFCKFQYCDDLNPCTGDLCHVEDGSCSFPHDYGKCRQGNDRPKCHPETDGFGDHTGNWWCVECDHDDDCYSSGNGVCNAGVCEYPCVDNSSCGFPPVCQGGFCTECTADAECPGDEFCENGRCKQCNDYITTNCASGICKRDGYECVDCNNDDDCADGYCEEQSSTCHECTSSDHCGYGFWCGGYVCSNCNNDGECPAGEVCNSSVCSGAVCSRHEECAANQVCDHGQCADTGGGGGGGCGSDADCATGVCEDGNCKECRDDAACEWWCGDDFWCQTPGTCGGTDLFLYDDGVNGKKVATEAPNCINYLSEAECNAAYTFDNGSPGGAGYKEYKVIKDLHDSDNLEQCWFN